MLRKSGSSVKQLPKVKQNLDEYSSIKSDLVNINKPPSVKNIRQSQAILKKPSKPNLIHELLPSDVSTFKGSPNYQSFYQEGLKKLKAYQYQEAFENFQKYLDHLSILKGKHTQSFQNDFKNLMNELNQYAMKLLNEPTTQEICLHILIWCEKQTQPHLQQEKEPIQRCTVLNNLGCAYRRTGKLQLAFNAMERALEIVQDYNNIPNKAITYLNLTAVLSQMGSHEKALKCSRTGVKEAQSSLTAYLNSGQQDEKEFIEKVRFLGIATHNMGAELEACNNLEDSIQQYKKAYELIREHIGQQDPLYQKFQNSYSRVKQKSQLNISKSENKLKQFSKTQLLRRAIFMDEQTDQSITFPTPQIQKKKIPKMNNFVIEDTSLASDQQEKSQLKSKERFFKKDIQQPLNRRSSGNYQSQPILQLQQPPSAKQSIIIQPPMQKIDKNKNDLEEIGVLEWSDSDQEVQLPQAQLKEMLSAKNGIVQHVAQDNLLEFKDNKDERIQFLMKMDLFEKEEALLRRQEELIIAEVENDLYDVKKIVKVQAQWRMKQQIVRYQRLKVEQRKVGKLKSDDLKLRKLQKFIRKKLWSLKQRQKTQLVVAKVKLRRYPKKEVQVAMMLQNKLRTKHAMKNNLIKVQKLKDQGYVTIWKQNLEPLYWDSQKKEIKMEIKNFNQRVFKFTFQLQYPDAFTVKFSLKPLEKKSQKIVLEQETEVFIRSLGLMFQYIDEQEARVTEQHPSLPIVRSLYHVTQSFLMVTVVGTSYVIRQKIDSFRELENAFKKLAPYLQQLVRIQNNKLQIESITDYEYNQYIDTIGDDEVKVLRPPVYFTQMDNKLYDKIIFIQKYARGIICRRKIQCLKNKKRKTLKRFTFTTHEKEYVTLIKCQEIKSGKRFYYLIVIKNKRKTNDLSETPIVFKRMGQVRIDNIFDIFDIDLKLFSLQYSEEGRYWIQKEIEDKKRKAQKITLKVLNQKASIIQKAIQNYLYKRLAQINLESRKRKNVKQLEVRKQIIFRRAVIYGQKGQQRAYLTSFLLFTEKINRNDSINLESLSMLASLKVDENVIQQSIMVQSKPLEHLYSLDKVTPFFQKLFYVVEISEMITIANMMIDMSQIKKGKHGVWKVDVKTLEEVQGILINRQRESNAGQVIQKKDETLQRRRLFNIQQLRPKFFTVNQSFYSFTDCQILREKLIISERDEDLKVETRQENYIKILQSRMRYFTKKKANAICQKKHVKDGDETSIRNYVKNFIPTTEYGIYEEGDEQKELEQQDKEYDTESVFVEDQKEDFVKRGFQQSTSKKLSNELRTLFDDDTSISNQNVHLELMFSEALIQIIAIVTLSSGVQLKTSISKSALLPAEDINIDFLQQHINRFVVAQLHIISNELLIYKSDGNVQAQLVKEQIEFTKKLQKEIRIARSIQLDDSKYLYDCLVESGKQAIRLDFLAHRDYDIEYIYEKLDHIFYVTVYQKLNINVRVIYKYPAKEFQCIFLNQELPNRPPEEIQKFFSPVVHGINQGLSVTIHENEIETSWEEMKMHLPQILKDKVILKIQGMLQIRRLMGKLKLYRELRKQEIFLGRYVECHDMHYTEQKYFLIKEKQSIKLLIKELNTIDGSGAIIEPKRGEVSRFQLRQKQFMINLREMKENYDFETVIENLKRSEQLSLQRLNFSRIDRFDIMKTLDYYRQLFNPLVAVIHNNLHIRYPSNNMQIQLLNLNIPFYEEKWMPKKRKVGRGLSMSVPWKIVVKAAMKMQQYYKKQRMKDWYKMKQKRKKDLEERRRYMGLFVKRQYRRYEDKLYLVNIFKREDKREQSWLFTFELIPYETKKKDRMNKQNRKKGYFSWEPTLMLNIGSIPLYEYLMDLLYIDQETNQVHFREYQYQLFQKQTMIPSIENAFEEQQSSALVEEEIPEKLVHHVEHKEDDQKSRLLYNVIYSGHQTLSRKKRTKQQKDENELNKDNTVKIEVDLKNLTKLYPTLSIKNPDLMKIVGQNLIDGIKVKDNGDIEVDQSKITPEFVKIIENHVNEQEFNTTTQQIEKPKVQSKSKISKTAQIQQQQQEKILTQIQKKIIPSVKQTLVKKTTIYNSMKYLVVIYYLEKRISKILQAAKDQVFEDFESVYQVHATNLSNVKEEAIVWEMSSEEAIILSHKMQRSDIAHSLSKKIQVLNKKFIFLAEEQKDILSVRINNKNVILFVEKAIKPIQQRFRNRNFQMQYKSYKEKIKEYREKDKLVGFNQQVASFELNSLKSSKQQFITMICEDNLKRIQLFAWDVDNFFFYEIEIQRQKYIQQYLENKIFCMRAMIHFVEFQADTRTLSFQQPKAEIFQEYFEEEKRQSQLNQSLMMKSQEKIENQQQSTIKQDASQTQEQNSLIQTVNQQNSIQQNSHFLNQQSPRLYPPITSNQFINQDQSQVINKTLVIDQTQQQSTQGLNAQLQQ